MKRTITEDMIREMVSESLKAYLTEKKVLKLHKDKAPNPMADHGQGILGVDLNSIGASPMGGGDMAGGDPNMGSGNMADPMAGGDPSAMGGADPSMGGGDPSMGGDPNAMGGDDAAPMSDTDGMGGGMPDDSSMGGGNPKADYIKQMVDKLGEDDLGAAEGYIESLLRDNQSSDDMGGGNDAPMGNLPESIIFTKGQLKKINEVFGAEEFSKKNKDKVEKRQDTRVKNSPFNSPRFK